MCWTLNHQNIIEMAQGHISLSTRSSTTRISCGILGGFISLAVYRGITPREHQYVACILGS
jgi:hypothetical protein